MPEFWNNPRGQALLLVITLLMVVSLLCTAALTLTHREKLTVKDSVEEAQAYYVADAAMEKVLSIIKGHVKVLDAMVLNKTYGKSQLESLATGLSGQDRITLQSLIGLFNTPFASLEILRENGDPHDPVQSTKAGTIQSISLTKTAADPRGYRLRIEVSGKYTSARRSLVANVRISRPLSDYSGILVQNAPNIYNQATIHGPLTILTNSVINTDSRFYDGIYIQGDCTLRPAADFTARELLVYGTTVLDDGAVFEGELKSKGDVLINGDVLNGPVRSSGNVTVGLGHVGRPANQEQNTGWDGIIYATGTISPATSDNFGTAYPNTPQTINHAFSEFPVLDIPWYEKNCDYYHTGDQHLRAEDLLPGIHYVKGNITMTGNYRGNITLVAAGTITIPSSARLKAQTPEEDSLLLLGAGDIQVHQLAEVEAILYCLQTVSLGSYAQLLGSLITRNLDCNGAAVTPQVYLKDVHPAWTTTEISIVSWQEKYPVFRID